MKTLLKISAIALPTAIVGFVSGQIFERKKNKPSYAGSIVIEDMERKAMLYLQLDCEIDELKKKKYAIFKTIVSHPEGPTVLN